MAYPFTSYQNPYQQGYYPYQMMQQPVQQPVQQQPQQQSMNQPSYYTGRIWVNGKSEVDFYPVAPNNAVDLWDRNGTTLYQKKADATGRPSVTVYDVVERAQIVSDNVSEQTDKQTAYATKDELKAVVEAVKGFGAAIASAQTDIDALKGDMYGIAGKKKPARKTQEVADDDE